MGLRQAWGTRPTWELLPALYAVVVGGAAFVTLGAGVLLALVSFPLSVTHFRWPGVRPGLRLAYWTGVAMNAFLFAVAVSALL
jgi:hypothetical protein